MVPAIDLIKPANAWASSRRQRIERSARSSSAPARMGVLTTCRVFRVEHFIFKPCAQRLGICDYRRHLVARYVGADQVRFFGG